MGKSSVAASGGPAALANDATHLVHVITRHDGQKEGELQPGMQY
jgi:hypothetical protein